jgi:hypothetical protein
MSRMQITWPEVVGSCCGVSAGECLCVASVVVATTLVPIVQSIEYVVPTAGSLRPERTEPPRCSTPCTFRDDVYLKGGECEWLMLHQR